MAFFAAWTEHHERTEDMLRNGRRDHAFFFEFRFLLFLFHAAPMGEAVFNLRNVGRHAAISNSAIYVRSAKICA